MASIIPSGHNEDDATSDDLDQSTTYAESKQTSSEWTDDVVETSGAQEDITREEVEDATNPNASDSTNTPDIPIDLNREAEGEAAGIYEIPWENLPDNIKDWIKAHPYQTAFHVVSGVVFFAPAAASGPLLYLLGFGSMGPRAGE